MSKLLKSKFLLGVMIVAVMVVGFAVASKASAATCDLGTVTLRQGSTGDAVKCLQTTLGITADGKFGPMTKAKVMAFQTDKGLTADGVVGAKTKAALAGTTTEALCPNGMTLASNCTTAPTATPTQELCPNGMTLASNCTTAPTGGTVATGNTDGSITAATSSYVSSGVTIKKGETKDVLAARLTAIVGPVKVTRVDATFTVRPWLFFGKVALHDNTGKVIAEKTLSSIADVTELTVGSSYLVRFDGLNYTVTPGTNPDLAISATVLAATDKIPSGGQSVTVALSDIRTMSEVGYQESATIPTAISNSVTLTSTGSVADIYSRVSQSSPANGYQQVVNATAGQTTSGVTLGVFGLKAANNSATLNTFKVDVTATTISQLSNYRLFVNGTDVGGATLSGTTLTWSNLTVALAQDAWVDLTVKADVAGASSGTVYLTLTPSTTTVVVTDSGYNTATVESGAKTTGTITLTSNAISVTAVSAALGSAITQNNYTTGYNATYSVTLKNDSNNDIYVSSTPSSMLTMSLTTTTGLTGSGTSLGTLNIAALTGDDLTTNHVYIVPVGSSRTFPFSGAAIYAGVTGTSGSINYKATSLNYVTSTGAALGSITTGLEALNLTAHF